MRAHSLKLAFKGDRDYVQGPDMLDGLCALLTTQAGHTDPRSLQFSVPRMTRQSLSVELLPQTEPVLDPQPVAVLSFLSRETRWRMIAREDGTPITERREYDEGAIAAAAKVDRALTTVRLATQLDYTDIELWTALNKLLLQTCFADRKGKWLFVRCELDRYTRSTPYAHVELQLVSNFHFRLTRTRITVDGAERGSIYFSLT